jgi:FkbM family methyltransferase
MIKLIQTKEGTVAVLKNDTHLSRWVEEKGTLHTDWLLDIILPQIQPGQVIVDAGSNIGDWTVPLSKAVGPAGKVYAFEPMPITFACLAVNTRDCENVEIAPYALSDRHEELLIQTGENAGASYITTHTAVSNGWRVLSVRLDSIKFDRLDWIKIDVEGSEFLTLLGAERTIEQHRPKVICEINRGALKRNSVQVSHITEYFRNKNYRMEFFDPKHNLGMEQTDVLFLPR